MAFVPTLELHDNTIPGLLRRNAKRLPDNDCVVAPEFGVRWSWKEFDRRTSMIARGLYAMGIRKGDHVAIWATNVPEWMLIMFASAKLGAILVTVNTNYKQFELNYLLTQSDAKMLVMIPEVKGNDYIDHITGLMPGLLTEEPDSIEERKLPFLKRVVLIGDSPKKPKGMYGFDELYTLAETVPDSQIEEIMAGLTTHEVINMQYTSGTTGFPKGVMLTHFNITNNGQFMGDCMKFTGDDRLLIVVPLFHCFGCVLGVMSCLTHCSTMVLMTRYSPRQEMEFIVQERCTAVHGVPTHVHRHAGAPGFRPVRLFPPAHWYHGGQPLPHQNHARRDQQNAFERAHHHLWANGMLPWHDHEPHRRPAGTAREYRGQGVAAHRG